MAVLTRYATLFAALLLAGSTAPVLAGVFTERWVVETRGESRVILGPRRMEICGEGACREVAYARSIAELRIRLGRAEGAVEHERVEAALERVLFKRKKGLQILVPGLVVAGLMAALAVLLFWRRERGISAWTRGSIRFVTCGLALGLVVFAVVFADGLSTLPADGARIHWGSSFYLVLGGCVLAFAGGILSGIGPKDERAGDGSPSTPSTSMDVPAPTSSIDDPAPSTSIDVPAPTSSIDDPAPSTSIDVPAPTSSIDDPAPSTSIDVPAPTTSPERGEATGPDSDDAPPSVP